MVFQSKRKSLECQQLDPGVFYKYNNLGNLIGIVGIHVDDFIHAGSKFFNMHVLEPVMKVFQVGKNEKGNFKYTIFYSKLLHFFTFFTIYSLN